MRSLYQFSILDDNKNLVDISTGIVHHAHNEYYSKRVRHNNDLPDTLNRLFRRIDLDKYRTDTVFSLYFLPDNNIQVCIGIVPDYWSFDQTDNKNQRSSYRLDNRDPIQYSICLHHILYNLLPFCFLQLVNSVLAYISSVRQSQSHNKHRLDRYFRLCYHVEP